MVVGSLLRETILAQHMDDVVGGSRGPLFVIRDDIIVSVRRC